MSDFKDANVNTVINGLIDSIKILSQDTIDRFKKNTIQTITGTVVSLKGTGENMLAKIRIGTEESKNYFDDISIETPKTVTIGSVVLCEYFGNNLANMAITRILKKGG